MKSIFPLILIVFLASGCTLYHIDSAETSLDYYPSKNSTKDIIYLHTMDREHSVIGYVTVNAERRQKMNEIVDRMKREAAIMGGDAITKVESDATGDWKQLPAQEIIGNAYMRANFRASVAVFK